MPGNDDAVGEIHPPAPLVSEFIDRFAPAYLHQGHYGTENASTTDTELSQEESESLTGLAFTKGGRRFLKMAWILLADAPARRISDPDTLLL